MASTSNVGDDTRSHHRGYILVVDDDPEILESLQLTLKAEGFTVSAAQDGNQGIAFVETSQPDLVILDMMMPRRSGFLVLEHIRQTSELEIPVIMITGNEGARHRQYAEMLGVSDYIAKPFTMDRLLQSVRKLMPHKT